MDDIIGVFSDTVIQVAQAGIPSMLVTFMCRSVGSHIACPLSTVQLCASLLNVQLSFAVAAVTNTTAVKNTLIRHMLMVLIFIEIKMDKGCVEFCILKHFEVYHC